MGTAANTAATHFAGIDVSKDTLDAALLGPDGRTRGKRFANDRAGFAALVAWADRHAAGARSTTAWRRPARTPGLWPTTCTPPAGSSAWPTRPG